MRILVTGATGFVGSRLVPALVDAGHEVTVLVRDAGGDGPPADSRVAEGDLLEPSSYAAALDVDAAYYLVHSMTPRDDVADRDRRALAREGPRADAATA